MNQSDAKRVWEQGRKAHQLRSTKWMGQVGGWAQGNRPEQRSVKWLTNKQSIVEKYTVKFWRVHNLNFIHTMRVPDKTIIRIATGLS